MAHQAYVPYDGSMMTSARTSASTFRRVATDLAHEPFPQLAAALCAQGPGGTCIDRILKQWRKLSLEAMPHLDALTREEFENSISEILLTAADAFRSADPQRLRGVMETGPQHGIDRCVQTYSLLDLFEEVRILRGVVIVELAEQMQRPLEVDEAATFHAIFDIIIQQGVIALVQKHDELLDQSQSTLVEMNEQLMKSSVFQNELYEQAEAMRDEIARQAEELARESRGKDEFLAMLSHELRHPLAPIRSAVHLLKMQEGAEGDNEVRQKAHRVIERQVDNLNELVSGLLEVSRVISGRVHLNEEIVDLNDVVRHAVETVLPSIEQRNHKLVVHYGGDEPEPVGCIADATRLEGVFVNVLNNAAKFTPNGGCIEIYCERLDQPGFVQVRIRDNGVGIDEEFLPRLFNLFTQADHSLARSSGGLGIGLALCQRIVELHGGSMEAHSPPRGSDVGSEFIVKLPTVPIADVSGRHLPEEPAADAHGLRVLVVDDNADLVMMLAAALRHKGYAVRCAHNGPDGLEVALRWRPDAVLLDIGLPGLNGYEVARRLRAAPPQAGMRDARLIALTGYGRDTDATLAKEAGFDAHLVKPCDFDELEDLLNSKNTRS